MLLWDFLKIVENLFYFCWKLAELCRKLVGNWLTTSLNNFLEQQGSPVKD